MPGTQDRDKRAEDYLAMQFGRLETEFGKFEARMAEAVDARVERACAPIRDKVNDLDDGQIEILKRLDENTAITRKVANLITFGSFSSTIIKWCAMVGGALVAAYAALKGLSK